MPQIPLGVIHIHARQLQNSPWTCLQVTACQPFSFPSTYHRRKESRCPEDPESVGQGERPEKQEQAQQEHIWDRCDVTGIPSQGQTKSKTLFHANTVVAHNQQVLSCQTVAMVVGCDVMEVVHRNRKYSSVVVHRWMWRGVYEGLVHKADIHLTVTSDRLLVTDSNRRLKPDIEYLVKGLVDEDERY